MTDAFPPRAARRHRAALALLMLLLALIAAPACATRERWTDPPDPAQPINRVMFGANMAIHRYIAMPVADVYRGVTPKPVRRGVANFFRNLSMPFVIVNDLLQGRFGWAGRDTLRFITNTTIGVAGIADPATKWGLEYRDQNFGVTAGVWGLGPGPYLMIPLIGPTTATSLPGIPLRIVLSPIGVLGPGIERAVTTGVSAVNQAETRRDRIKRVREAIEPYSYVKSAYTQKQWEMIDKEVGEEEADVFDELPEDLFEEDLPDDASDDLDEQDSDPEQTEAPEPNPEGAP